MLDRNGLLLIAATSLVVGVFIYTHRKKSHHGNTPLAYVGIDQSRIQVHGSNAAVIILSSEPGQTGSEPL